MRKPVIILSAALAAAAALGGGAVTASADPPGGPNVHNCAGAFVSNLAGPGFGRLVAGVAHAQGVDNLGLRNCGDTQGQNP